MTTTQDPENPKHLNQLNPKIPANFTTPPLVFQSPNPNPNPNPNLATNPNPNPNSNSNPNPTWIFSQNSPPA
jgi:hypothetical protein